MVLIKLVYLDHLHVERNAKDIDIYLDIETYEIKKLLKFKKELEKLSNKEIDLVLKKYANPIILYRAQKDMRYVTE